MTKATPTPMAAEDDKQGLARLAQFEDCASAIDGLFQQALATTGAGAFDAFLDFVRSFKSLSVYNAMLVRVQRPGAAAVASRREWRKRGRTVLADAIPIVLLQPFGPVRFVYEVSDTEGREIPGEKASSLFAAGELPQKVYDNTRKAAEKFGITVVETDRYGALLAGTAAGISVQPVLDPARKTLPFRVKLNAKHDLPTRFATLAHELGHIYCGHIGRDRKGRWPDRSHLSVELCEMEAEAVAWLVCQRNGVQARSKEYLGSLIGQVDPGQVSLYAIFEAANRVESRTQPVEWA
ncbi:MULTISPECIES: ImmA/IrrE family metallo-endopeptidase [unclassified Thiocapsa]|uniref:ImmA/IrrE family metallo-endopeptidase n=1 Tax=unclassified Thiocapsa TaxID=2641286 RepID=UPI0035B322C2